MASPPRPAAGHGRAPHEAAHDTSGPAHHLLSGPLAPCRRQRRASRSCSLCSCHGAGSQGPSPHSARAPRTAATVTTARQGAITHRGPRPGGAVALAADDEGNAGPARTRIPTARPWSPPTAPRCSASNAATPDPVSIRVRGICWPTRGSFPTCATRSPRPAHGRGRSATRTGTCWSPTRTRRLAPPRHPSGCGPTSHPGRRLNRRGRSRSERLAGLARVVGQRTGGDGATRDPQPARGVRDDHRRRGHRRGRGRRSRA